MTPQLYKVVCSGRILCNITVFRSSNSKTTIKQYTIKVGNAMVNLGEPAYWPQQSIDNIHPRVFKQVANIVSFREYQSFGIPVDVYMEVSENPLDNEFRVPNLLVEKHRLMYVEEI